MELFFIALILLPFLAYFISQNSEKGYKDEERSADPDEEKRLRSQRVWDSIERRQNKQNLAGCVLVILNIAAIIGTGGFWILVLIGLWAVQTLRD